jgi:hypothetical protein
MRIITTDKEYSLIQNQTNVTAAMLFYTNDDLESSLAEVALNNLDKKYSSDMIFLKSPVNQKILMVNNQTIELPVVQILNDGSYFYFPNPINFTEVEQKIVSLLEHKESSMLANLPARPERIKRKLLERKWIAWTFIIGAALIAIIKFVIELDKKSDSNRR